MAGRVSNAVPNTILSGPSAPRSTIGIEGDFYIDSKAFVFYGPKSKSGWPAPISLRGPQGLTGAKGASGSNGTDGKSSATSGAVGPQGAAGPVGPRGEAGAAGVVGPAGPTGAVGPAGAPGTAGVPGTSGAQGIAGAAGSQGSPGASGAPGSVGATGGIGLTGASGPAGPSNGYQGDITFASSIQGTTGTSQISDAFGSFAPGKNYIIHIQIQSYNAAQLLLIYPLSFSVSSQGAAPVISNSYTVTNGSRWLGSVKRDEVVINADIAVNGSSVLSSYTLAVTIACGTNTSTFSVALTGNYVGVLVGQLT